MTNSTTNYSPSLEPVRKVWLFSAGGCGTRMFHTWLDDNGIHTNDQGSVHKMNFPEELASDARVVYLHGNPVDSVLSFYGKYLSGHTSFLEQHCNNLGVPKVPDDIREYVASGRDLFGIIAHNRRWWNKIEEYGYREQMLYFTYDDLWGYCSQRMIREELKPTIPFPKEKPRTLKSWVTQDILNGLKRIYGQPV